MNDSIKHPDKLASERLKERRLAVGISQKELGQALDISALQVKKYEEGLSRLYVFAKVLNTSLKYFFNSSEEEKLKTDDENTSNNKIEYLFKEIESDFLNNIAEEEGQYENDISFDYKELSRTMERELLSLTRAFTRVQNPNIRKIIIELVRSVSIPCE
ncbi:MULTISPECIES: helix-turn-helix domain-containing protein [spotted fever group]|uniref:Helix-turn-helix domain protein n=1 Tax=Rickettsia tamurae subsp. buchneri TaxID=1462938 RepID=A0A8E0WN12_9RICK|nr:MULTISPECIES: helix-turn-helix domain-containing protein [spotted fever group]EER21776.1 helix-turn-helix domain protein [Rickettsia endosymbiont of Ixodes scapularis]KDO03641.1 helix-turn-helix domain protein [Rickettsia tamurae subsp. buchneri]